jgi:hypothetical protein
VPFPGCGGNFIWAAWIPATRNTKGRGLPSAVSSTSRSESPGRRWNRSARVKEILRSLGRSGSASRPDRIFLFQKPPGIALLAGTKSWMMPGVTLKFLITAASVAWGTRITAPGARRAKLATYGSAMTTELGALLQSRRRA